VAPARQAAAGNVTGRKAVSEVVLLLGHTSSERRVKTVRGCVAMNVALLLPGMLIERENFRWITTRR
jgi:hypothetical protein